MKKIYLLALVLFSSVIYSQTKGITYQAVILNPEGQHIPGFNNERTPLANTAICLRFSIYKAGVLEYQETKNTITDEFGMVNVIIGSGVYVGGTSTTLAGVNWDGNAKNLVVEVDAKGLCTNFIEISNQPFAYVPYAFYAENSGTPGPQGPQGQQGPQGVPGPQGPQGPAGTSGLSGATGPVGPQGAQGVAGPAGATGAVGATGPQGLQGIQGVAGATGAQGPAGVNGASAYQVAVANGFVGTEAQWLASLVGPQGATGPQGSPGTGISSIGSNAAFSDAITTFNGDISYCGTYTALAVSSNGKYIILGCRSFATLDSNGNALVNGAGKVSVIKYENGTFENVGQELIGSSLNANFGIEVGISDDGQTIFFVGNTPNNGYIYKLINNTWVLHSTIPGIGFIKSKMNATADLIVSLNNSGNNAQSVTFYKLNGTNWVPSQFFANGILGNSDLQISNDGSIIALSNYGQNLGVLGGYPSSGRVGVFYYNGTTFTQRGNFIEGPNTKGWGYRFCLTDDGSKIGITTQSNNINSDSSDPCYIRTYQFSTSTNSWDQYNNELVFKSNNLGGEITFFDFDSSSNHLIVAHKIESPFANEYKKSYFLLLKNLNNTWNQFGTRIEFIPTYIPDNFDFKSNIFFYVQDDKLRIKDFN